MLIATPENPCVCGNRDYQTFWCERCKRPEDSQRKDNGFCVPMNCTIINPNWIINLFKALKEPPKE